MSTEDCVEKLEQLLIDESRLVTYKLLSRELKIHVNKAKQCMFDFLTMKNLKDVHLEAYYFLAGFVEKDGMRAVRAVVVSQDSLEKIKKEFKELTSCHIYSLNRGKLRNDCALYTTDFVFKNAEEQSKYSAVKHPSIEIEPPLLNKMQCVKKDEEPEISKKQGTASFEKGCSSSMWPKKVVPSEQNHSLSEDKTENKSAENSSRNQTSPEEKVKKGTLMSMWSKKEEKPNPSKRENSKGKQSQVKNAGKNNILSMFSKQAVKNAEIKKEESVKKESSSKFATEEIEKQCIQRETESKKSKNITSKMGSKVPKSANKKRKSSNRQSSKASNQQSDSDSESEFQPKKKKHRRICTFEDSDSESECEEAQDRNQRSLCMAENPPVTPMPESDDSEEPIPPTPPVAVNKIKGKAWKTVQKTYQDEDGFFVTKKEKELVSEPEDNEDPLQGKIKETSNDFVPKPFFHSKQASLTSFFTKK